jgi:predicted nucleic acid-binding Zn ribbon protein
MSDSEIEGGASSDAAERGAPVSEASRVYLRFKEIFTGTRSRPQRSRRARDDDESVPFGHGRDPKGLGDVVGALTADLGWDSPLAQSELMSRWTELAGEETAKHSSPVGIEKGVLTVQCESTAWATQLRLMRTEIMTHITTRFPEAGISNIRFLGPDVPSWKRGPRSVQGRGVRDTYG